jgi:hypothetical protein
VRERVREREREKDLSYPIYMFQSSSYNFYKEISLLAAVFCYTWLPFMEYPLACSVCLSEALVGPEPRVAHVSMDVGGGSVSLSLKGVEAKLDLKRAT